MLIVADASADPDLVAADLLAQAEHGPGSRVDPRHAERELADAVLARVGAAEQVRTRLVDSLDDALAFANDYAPEHLQLMGAEAEALAPACPPRRRGLPRRSLGGRSATTPRDESRPADGRARAGARRARPGGLPEADRGRPHDAGRAGGGAPDRRGALGHRRPAAARRGGRGQVRAAMTPQPTSLPDGFRPYVWAPPLEEQAAARGLSPAQVIRFDANVPPLPGVPQVALTQSFARLNEYPPGGYRELHAAAAGYVGVEPEQICIGAGADELIFVVARTFLGAGPHARSSRTRRPTRVYRIASELALAEVIDAAGTISREADVIWVCSPHNPTGRLARARRSPRSRARTRTRSSSSTRRTSSTAARRRCR